MSVNFLQIYRHYEKFCTGRMVFVPVKVAVLSLHISLRYSERGRGHYLKRYDHFTPISRFHDCPELIRKIYFVFASCCIR
jgi:hypothetical protein